MALSAERLLEFVGEQEEISPLITASVTYYTGGVLVYAATGYAAKPTDTAALYPAGILTGIYQDGVRDDAYAPGAVNVRAVLKRGKVWIPFSGAAQTDVGLLFYLADDNTLTKTAGSKTIAFPALDFKTGFVLIDLRVPIKAA
jgi:hypothetical protein